MEAVQTILQATGSAQMAPPPADAAAAGAAAAHSATLPPQRGGAACRRAGAGRRVVAAAAAAAGSQRKSLSTWHRPRGAGARVARAERVARKRRPGKREVVVAAAGDAFDERRWEVPCDSRCTASGCPAWRSARRRRAAARCRPGCARVLRDGFLDVGEQEALSPRSSACATSSTRAAGRRSPDAASAARQWARRAALFRDVLRRVQATIAADFGLPALYSAGSLLTRIWADDQIPDDGMNIERHKYWNAHVDEANRASYDYSALLYLSAHCAAAAAFDHEHGAARL